MAAQRKIRILATGDWIDTGFGTVMRNLFPRLARTGLFEIHLVGWHYRGDINLAKEAIDAGIRLYPTMEPEQGTVYMQDLTGAISCKRLVRQLQPDVFFALGDPWQMPPFTTDDFAATPKVFYVPIDTDVLSMPHVKIITKADVLVLYSRFGQKVIKAQAPFTQTEMIYHGVDTEVFKPISDAARKELRESQKYESEGEPWIVLVVGQNQIRKGHSRAVTAFKAATCEAFNNPDAEVVVDGDKGEKIPFKPAREWCENVQKMRCEKCPLYRPDPKTASWFLHFHCVESHPAGWDLREVVYRHGLDGRVRCTQGINHAQGLTKGALARMMAAADVHFLMTHREGFGLPILETMACGTPNVVTDYSACTELLEEGGGYPVAVKDFHTTTFHQAVDAIPDIADAARGLRRMFEDRAFYEEQRRKGIEFSKTLNWDRLLPLWIDLFRRAAKIGRPNV